MIKKASKAILRHLTMEADDTLRRIEEDLPNHPDAMSSFYDLYRKAFSGSKPLEGERKIVGLMCTHVPEELIHACKAIPLRLCSGFHAFDHIGSDFMPARSCPLVRSSMGMLRTFEATHGKKPDLIVVPTTCDQKKKSAEMLAELGFNVHYLEVPSRKDTEAAGAYWEESVFDFAETLQRLTGTRLTEKRLRSAIAACNGARRQFRRLHRILESRPGLMWGTDVLLVANAYLLDELTGWTEATEALNDELEASTGKGRSLGGREPVRILLTGSPPVFPNLKVPILIEGTGARIAADETCCSSRLLYDAVGYDEGNLHDLLPSIADRYMKPCTCPFLAPNPDRKRKLLDLSARFGVDGVVYQSLSGCSPYEMEQRSVASALSAEGIPMLHIETDYSPEDTGQLSTRIEAFVESLAIRKEGEAR